MVISTASKRYGLLAAVVAAAGLGAVGAAQVIGSDGAPVGAITAVSDTSDPAVVEPDMARYGCPPPAPSSSAEARGVGPVGLAAAEAGRFGQTRPDLYTGLVVCEDQNWFAVYRLESEKSFDQRMSAVADRFDVDVKLRRSSLSSSDTDDIRAQVRGRSEELKARGAELYSMTGTPDGPVVVGVLDNPDAARDVLADLGDDVRVERTARGGPL